MPSLDRKQIGAVALAALAVIALAVMGREALQQGALGESHNPNFGHPSTPHRTKGQGSHGFDNMTEEQYYEGLKDNRPDLSETELRAKADHWWKVRNGEATVSGG